MGALVSVISQTKAQSIVFNETFETSTTAGVPVGWTATDLDGDGNSWVADDEPGITDPMGFSGKVALCVEDTPNDLLGSPSINLPVGTLNLTYQIGSYTGNGAVPFNNHYAVYILPVATPYSAAAVPVLEESLSAGDTALNKTINLSSYAGQNVRIYFRFFDSGIRVLILDNVKVTQTVLGTSEADNNPQVGIYPNPATDYITIKSNSKLTNVEVYDAAGRKMIAPLNIDKIDVKSLQPGNYIMKVETSKGINTTKFIKK
ncbi:T9SS-dependent choice-of-anchor J family protein [Chryseobacterium soldanellicola]|uniref:T9SS-dependent choice-of-anchor J family protein n=1 Tax=Chryseobacterium soldanellicola TaxID=311333 RepID=UPI00147F1E0D|nr:T9SS type A sorting domain-containing protein [Chryseobacterium soldanellicola]